MSQIKQYSPTCDCMSQASWGDYVLHADHLASHAYDDSKEQALADQFIKAQQARLAKGGHAPLTRTEESAMRGAWKECARSRAKAAGCE